MTISYPDVSNHNGAMPLQSGTVACFAKASEGTGFRDAQYAHFKAEAARVGALFSAYHFLHAGNGAAQARWAFSIVGPGVPMMIDFEPSSFGGSPTVADAVGFRDAYRALGGLCTSNYLPRWYWEQLGSPPLGPLRDLALISSQYTAYSDTGPGWAAYGGLSPAIWQWTDQQPYAGQRVDFNAFRGTVDELRALLGLARPAADPTRVEEPDMILHSITGSPEVWALSGSLYWHVADEASLASYKAAGVPQATVTAVEHAAILAASVKPAPAATLVLTDAQAAVIGAAIAAKLPTHITGTQTTTVSEDLA